MLKIPTPLLLLIIVLAGIVVWLTVFRVADRLMG